MNIRFLMWLASSSVLSKPPSAIRVVKTAEKDSASTTDRNHIDEEAQFIENTKKECCVGSDCDQDTEFGDYVTFQECQSGCLSTASCIAFEYGNEGKRCQASDSCRCYLVKDGKGCSDLKENERYNVYLRSAPGTHPRRRRRTRRRDERRRDRRRARRRDRRRRRTRRRDRPPFTRVEGRRRFKYRDEFNRRRGASVRRRGNPNCKRSREDYQASIDALLAEREGWGEDTVGGKGQVYVVNSTDDSDQENENCTLRHALESSDEYWIVFDEAMRGKEIPLFYTIYIESHKTIAGRGSGVTIRAPPHYRGEDHSSKPCKSSMAFMILGKSQIIISDLRIDGDIDDDKWDADGECADAIHTNDSTYIWFHHNTVRRFPDEAFQFKPYNDFVSITNNKIEEIYQAMSLNGGKFSFGRNYCKKVRRRCIKLSMGHGHSYNNVMWAWNDRSIQNTLRGSGTPSGQPAGQLYSQQNVFKPDEKNCGRTSSLIECREVNKVSGGSKMRLDHNHAFPGGAEIVWKDMTFGGVDEGFMKESKKKVDVTECSTDDEKCVRELYDDVTQHAGQRV